MSREPFKIPQALTVDVPDRELARLLSWPAGMDFRGQTAELVQQTRELFNQHGQSWNWVRIVPVASIEGSTIRLASNESLTSPRLSKKYAQVEVDAVAVIGATVQGPILQVLADLWANDEGDLAFIVASYCSAYAEQSLQRIYESLCEWSISQETAALVPASPGNEDLEFEGQHGLYRLIASDPLRAGAMPVDILDSGALSLQPSVLAISGLTHRLDLAESTPGYRPCSKCSRKGCSYRRSPYAIV